MQQQIIDKRIQLYCIDAYNIASISGMGNRINTIMQTCFFSISGVLPADVAIKAIKDSVEKTYGRKGKRLVELNFKAIDETLANLHEVAIPNATDATFDLHEPVSSDAPDFVKKVTGEIIAGRGDQIPVSLFPLTAPILLAPPPTRNAISHWKFRCWMKTCAPSAVNVRWSVRTA